MTSDPRFVPPPLSRRDWLGLGLLSLAGCATPPEPRTGPAPNQVVPFSAAQGDEPAVGWHSYVMHKNRTQTSYRSVVDGGRRVLRARAQSAVSGLRCDVAIDPLSHPMLNFSWRVAQAPDAASVQTPERDDAPARVVITFGGDEARLSIRERLFYDQVELFTGHRLPFATLMYVWDGALPVDTLTPNHRTQRIQYLTVESGAARVGQWLSYRRDLQADCRRVFGEAPGPVQAVGVLTDSDALKLDFEAWYGDISLQPRA